MYLAIILLSLILLVPAIQDFRSRSIYWLPLPLIFISFFLIGYSQWNLSFLLFISFSNLVMIGFQTVVIILYFKLSRKKRERVIDKYLGLGDILLLIALSPGFIPLNFILFVTSVAFIVLLIYLIIKLSGRSFNPEIPLAGFICFCLITVLLIELFLNIDIRYYNIQLLYL